MVFFLSLSLSLSLSFFLDAFNSADHGRCAAGTTKQVNDGARV